MSILSVVGGAACAVIGILLLRRYSLEFAQLMPIAASVILLLALVPQIATVLDGVRELADLSLLDPTALEPVFRGIAILLLTRFASSVCYDCGQRSLGETVDYCGQIALVTLCLPYVLDLARGFARKG